MEFSETEKLAFEKIFTSEKYKINPIYEVVADKIYRHQYCLVGNDLLEEITKWFNDCGLKFKITNQDRIFTEIELI